MRIEIYRETDRDRILELYYQVWGRRMTKEFWDWRFVDSKQDSIRCLMWDDDHLVGNYAVHSLPMKIGNHIEKVLFSMDTLTHPNYRNKGVFTNLANFTMDIARNSGYRLIFGFPNKNSYETFFTKLGWTSLGSIKEYEKHIKPDDVKFDNTSAYTITQINIFDNRVDNLWEDYKNEHDIIIPRTKDYLNWRFFKRPEKKFLDYPTEKYFVFLVERIGLQAYFVLKKFGNDKGHLVDYFGLSNKEILKTIIKHAISFCLKNGLGILSFWLNPSIEEKNMLEMLKEFGFGLGQNNTYFGIKVLKNIQEPVTDKNQWFINMSDSDVY